MGQRPISVTIVAWALIVIAVISLLVSPFSLRNPAAKQMMNRSPLPIVLQYTLMFLGLFITLLSGIAILKGKNWARFLYIIWGVISFGIGITISPVKPALIPGVVIFIVVSICLLLPNANEYFKGSQ
ncbi:hypothetical protein ACFL2O_11455 [Thermodesulfobacteriota bacterium]